MSVGRGTALAIVALIVGGLTAYVPWHYRAVARSVPPIDDITTDTANPPRFIALVPLREAEHSNPSTYGDRGVATSRLSRYRAFNLPLALDKAFALALATARRMGWTIVASDPASGRIEATRRSFWMGFTDNIVLRVVRAGSGSRVDLRPPRVMDAAISVSMPPASEPISPGCVAADGSG